MYKIDRRGGVGVGGRVSKNRSLGNYPSFSVLQVMFSLEVGEKSTLFLKNNKEQ